MQLKLFCNMKPSLDCIIKPTDQQQSVGGLYLGNISSVFKSRELHQCKAVLSVIQDVDMELIKQFVNSHLLIQLDDIDDEQISTYFDQTHEFIKQHIQTTNVLVHCMAGISRSSTIVIAYLMREYHMSFSDALNLVRTRRDIVQPNDGFLKQLKQYEKTLQGKL